MNKMRITLLFLTLFSTHLLTAQQDQTFLEYIDTYKDIAIEEMERAGIPASIKLAQGLLESSAGQSNLATRANNHFGIKCGGVWSGRTYYQEDDDYNEFGQLVPSCFRVYRDAQASFRAHSDFLRNPNKSYRYGELFDLHPTDYKGWAKGLKSAGYATSRTYDKKLIKLIERYNLQQYDLMSSQMLAQRQKPVKKMDVLHTNDVKYVVSLARESLEDIAARTAISMKYLQKYNDGLLTNEIIPGTRVYIQPKRNAYRGREGWHTVQPGETMFTIAQNYGLKLSKLYDRNRLAEGTEPAVGEQVKLRGSRVDKTPRVARAANGEVIVQNQAEQPENDGEYLEMEEPERERPFAKALEALRVRQEATADVPLAEEKAHYRESSSKPMIPGLERLQFETETDIVETAEPEAPDGGSLIEPTFEETVRPVPSSFHEVRQGDTLWRISQRYQTTVDTLRRLNQLEDNSIRAGMRLRVR
jgi:LysM repeat protein